VKLNLIYVAVFCIAASTVTPAFAQNAGADTYKAKCAMCHGADGLGATTVGKKLKAVSFKDASVVKAPDAELIAAVKHGKGNMKASVSASLTDAQIKDVIAYVRTLQK
jgi:mono/diheme cytochrome c family protein